MRYLPLDAQDRRAMLEAIGVASVDELFCDVPREAILDGPVDLPGHQGEQEVLRHLRDLAGRNLPTSAAPSFLGAGAYRHFIPASVEYLLSRGEFLTAYTPYQPEISQGTLQALFEFQTQTAMLTGMEVANASLYDGSTAAAEAVLMARRITRRKKIVLSGRLHPHYAQTIATMTRYTGENILAAPASIEGAEDLAGMIDDETACVVVQNPDFFGAVGDLSALAAAAHDQGALLIVVVTEALSLGAIRPPGDMGADIVAGEGQSFGNPLSYGGPYLGLFATRQRYVRQMPGRLVGQTVDADGRRGYVLTLSTREQHIRREKATSNICTNSGLCALAFCIHLTLLGEAGLRRLATLNHEAAITLAAAIDRLAGAEVVTKAFFNEFAVRLSRPAGAVVEALAARGVLAGVPAARLLPGAGQMETILLVAANETQTSEDRAALLAGLEEVLS